MAIALGSAVQQATFESLVFDMYTYRPSGTIKGILFVHHGNSRNPDDYRTYGIPVADHQKLVIVAPYFDSTRFDNNAYHRGNIINQDTGDIRPQSQWTTRFIPLMAAWARSEVGGTLPYYLWGHSAGGQFVARVAAFGQPPARRLVSANPSTHVLPQIGVYPSGEKAPYGMGLAFSASEEVQKLKNYVGMPFTLYQGGNDVDPSDPDLSRGDAPDRQGLYRLERGLYTYAMGQQVATDNGWRFGWRLVIGPEIAHDGDLMLMSRRVLDALGLYDTHPVFRVTGQSGAVSLRLRFRGFDGRVGAASAAKTATAA